MTRGHRPYFRALLGVLSLAVTMLSVASCGNDGTGPEDEGGSELDADSPPVTDGDWYRPAADVSWQWQLDGEINTEYAVEVYDIDLFEAPDAVLEQLQADGIRVICYFSAGTYEPGRPDASSIPESAIGRALEDWPDERWLDIRRLAVFEVMVGRLDLATARNCDGVEPDNVTAFAEDSGFPITATDQLAFNRNLANEAHLRGLSIGLKNDGDQAEELVDYFDFELNEECHFYDECLQLKPFLDRGKPVLNVEYADDLTAARSLQQSVCPAAEAAGVRTLILPWELDDAFRVACF